VELLEEVPAPAPPPPSAPKGKKAKVPDPEPVATDAEVVAAVKAHEASALVPDYPPNPVSEELPVSASVETEVVMDTKPYPVLVPAEAVSDVPDKAAPVVPTVKPPVKPEKAHEKKHEAPKGAAKKSGHKK